MEYLENQKKYLQTVSDAHFVFGGSFISDQLAFLVNFKFQTTNFKVFNSIIFVLLPISELERNSIFMNVVTERMHQGRL